MMDAVKEWIASVVTVTMLLSVAQAMVPDGRIRKSFSFTGGLVLMIVLLQPILEINAEDLSFQTEFYEEQIQARQEELEQNVRAEWETIIERETTAYILDKADALGLELSAEVQTETDANGLPVLSVELAGESSEVLTEYLAEELGIPRERQVWNHERKN